jgi:diguanylate cyclase
LKVVVLPMTGAGEMGLSTRVTIRGGLICAMALLLAGAVVGGLTLQGGARTLAVDGLGVLAVWTATGVCWLAVARVGSRRCEARLAAAAVTSLAAGLTYLALEVARSGVLPLVSPGYVANMLFYPLMLAALVAAVRHDVRGPAMPVWLDSAVGYLGAAAVLAVLLSPVLDSIPVGPPSLATGLAIACPMLDMLLIATVAGIAALRGVRVGSRWGLLVVGLMVFAGANIVLALQRTKGTYVVGTPLDAGWAIGLALVAMWVDGAAQLDGSNRQEARPASGRAALVVSAVPTMTGLGVLLMGTRAHLSTLAVSLAGVTLLAATGRTHRAFGQLARMADLRRRAAATDELTGLHNRRVLYAEGRARLVDPQRRRQALLMLDLNKFKEVNDSLGHHAGDQLLIQVGARLNGQMRAGDLLARLGGDEFSVLLRDAGRDQAVDVAVMLREVLAEPFDLEGITVHSSASIGIALFPDHGLDLSNLLRKADIAMYKAKTSGNGHHVYGTADDADLASRLRTVEELRTALTSNQLVRHYQPLGQLHERP